MGLARFIQAIITFFGIVSRASRTNRPAIPDRIQKNKAQSEFVTKALVHDFPKARVKWVIDGDTVVIAKGWSGVRIRLDSIDCPEDGQHWGNVAKFALIKLTKRRKVHIEEHGIDDHGRMLATLYIWHSD